MLGLRLLLLAGAGAASAVDGELMAARRVMESCLPKKSVAQSAGLKKKLSPVSKVVRSKSSFTQATPKTGRS